jgi:hypothetical protein
MAATMAFALTAAIGAAGLVFGEVAYRGLAFQILASSWKTVDPSTREAHANRLIDRVVFPSPLRDEILQRPPAGDPRTIGLLEVEKLVHDSRYEVARSVYHSLKRSALLAPESDAARLDLSTLDGALAHLLSVLSTKEKGIKEGELLEQTRARLMKQFSLVQADMRDLFGAPTPASPPATPEVYRGGVLEGLPQLPELRDNLTHMDDLRSAVREAGLQVSLAGEDVHERFNDRISLLRKVAGEIVGLLSSNETRHAALHREREATEQRLGDAKQTFLAQIRTTVLDNLRPDSVPEEGSVPAVMWAASIPFQTTVRKIIDTQ